MGLSFDDPNAAAAAEKPLELKIRPGNQPPNQADGQSPLMSPEGSFGGAVASRQWIRAISVLVGGAGLLDLSNLRVQFMVRQADIQHPNYCTVRITNLSRQTSQLGMMKEFDKVEVRAGYQGRIGYIFKGQVMQKRSGKEENGVDRYFDILGTSNHQAYGFATVSKTLAAGHTFKDIVDECTKKFKESGVDIGHIADLGTRKMPRASVLHGNCKDILREVGLATNTSWSIQNETFQMVKNDGYLPGEAKVLNSNTGMIGIPEQTLQGIVVKCLIDPGMKVGARVHINESSINRAEFTPSHVQDPTFQQGLTPKISDDGIYKVYRVDHDGDTEGTVWYTTLTCLALDDSSAGGGETIARAAHAGDFRGVSEEADNWGNTNSGGSASQ